MQVQKQIALTLSIKLLRRLKTEDIIMAVVFQRDY